MSTSLLSLLPAQTSEKNLDELLSGAGAQSPSQTAADVQNWKDLLDAGDGNNWVVAAEKAQAFLKAPGYHEPLQTQFAQTLLLILSEKGSSECDALHQQLNDLNAQIYADQRALAAAKRQANESTAQFLNNFLGSLITVNGRAVKPPDPTVVPQQNLNYHLNERNGLEQRLQEAEQRDATQKAQLRNVVLNNLKALEENQMTRPLVILASAYQYVVPFDVEVASYAQNYASVSREADKIIAAALYNPRRLEAEGRFWSARDAVLSARADVDAKVTDATLLGLLHKDFDVFTSELDRRTAPYPDRLKEIIQTVGRLKYSEAVGLRKDFDALEEQFPDNPSRMEDEATFNNALLAQFNAQIRGQVKIIQKIVAQGQNFREARTLIDGLAKEVPSDDLYTIAYVKSLIEKQRRTLFDNEIQDINKRIDNALNEISPYGSATTNEFRAGRVVAFSTVDLVTKGRTNLIKALSMLEGIKGQLAEFAADSNYLDTAQQGQLIAAERTSEAATTAVNDGLKKVGQTTRWIYVFAGAFVLAVAGALYLLLRPKRRSKSRVAAQQQTRPRRTGPPPSRHDRV